MFISESTLDDLLHAVLLRVKRQGKVVAATRGSNKELFGVLLELKNPRNRLSRSYSKGTLFSCIGEFLWYFTKDNKLDFVEYYIPGYSENSCDGVIVHGGYGPRFFNMRGMTDQITNIIELLKRKPGTRKAVIQLFNAEDLERDYKDIPCTCTLQFVIRSGRLNLMVNMRSNDVFLGLPHDVFSFTLLQEIIARTLNVELGVYKHSVGSLHIYDEDRSKVEIYLDEGYQSTNKEMPRIPDGTNIDDVFKVISYEALIRSGFLLNIDELEANSYWKDMLRILQLYSLTKSGMGSDDDFGRIIDGMSSDIYKVYLDKRISKYKEKEVTQREIEFHDR